VGEEILKIEIGELTTIRMVENGIAYEMPIGKIDQYLQSVANHPLAGVLRQLKVAIEALSQKPSGIKTEFVIPVKR
jgi:hypothetical protein